MSLSLWLGAGEALLNARLRLALDRARSFADDPLILPARVSAPQAGIGRVIASVLPATRADIAGTLAGLGRKTSGDNAARALGLANLLAGKPMAAVDHLERIRTRRARDWNDIAAAWIIAARAEPRPDRWLAALVAEDQALLLDRSLPEALYNRALIVDAIGVTPAARAAWQTYLRIGASSAWARAARQRVASYTADDSAAWKAATTQIERLTAADLEALTNRYPQAARRYADVVYLSSWAASLKAERRAEANAHLDRIAVIARTLAQRGEPLLADAVAAIADTARDRVREQSIVEAQLAYQRGRLCLFNGDPVAAERELRTATALFARGGSSMRAVAEFWLASALSIENRADEALRLLTSLVPQTRYPSITGQVQYQLALEEAALGNWSQSLSAAQTAKAAFTRISERGNVANADAMLSEDYDLLGQPELAWRHGFAALRGSAADGAFDRTRVALAGLCRTEARGRRWERALSLAHLEAEIAPLAPDVRLGPDLFIREAAAEWHLRDEPAARASLGRARGEASRIADPATRAKLLADVDSAEGAFVRHVEPRRAVALFSSAITFQRMADRPITLPELFLERGRSFLAVDQLKEAEADFESGIAELERQRNRVTDAELRPGIFDDSSELFDEAIALQLRMHADVDGVLRYVERGRARSMLEQISAKSDRVPLPPPPSVADIQRALAPATALLEYVVLPDRLVIVVITRSAASMRVAPIRRDTLADAARRFVDTKGSDGHELYAVIVAPVLEDLQGIRSIDIVTPDVLERVPFAALANPVTRTFLIESYQIATSPSAGVLLAILQRMQHRAAAPANVLIIANPAVPRETFGDLPPLAAAEAEATRIARFYRHADVFIHEAATAERFRQLAPTHDVVHFGGHGVNDEREPFASALVCAATPRHGGAVTAHEVARMKFRSTRVVVLAACSTMTGRNAAVEGVPSLASAFIVAGVPAVVGTLWDIEDREAAAVTRPLHRELARGVRPAEALRAAQLDAIRRSVPVTSWSAFALIGSSAAD